MRFIYSYGEGNGIFRWNFYGDRDKGGDVTNYYEEIADDKAQIVMNQEETAVFDDLELARMTEEQIAKYQESGS